MTGKFTGIFFIILFPIFFTSCGKEGQGQPDKLNGTWFGKEWLSWYTNYVTIQLDGHEKVTSYSSNAYAPYTCGSVSLNCEGSGSYTFKDSTGEFSMHASLNCKCGSVKTTAVNRDDLIGHLIDDNTLEGELPGGALSFKFTRL